MYGLAIDISLLAFLLQCIRFLWKVELERYKMAKKKPPTTPNRRRNH